MSDTLTIQSIGDGIGVILPTKVLDHLKVARGDKVYVTFASDGIQLSRHDPTFAMQMKVAREVMDDNYNVLRELAKK